MSKWIMKFAIIISMLALLAGCWDRVEIEQRGFVIGAAVDNPKNIDTDEFEEKEAKTKPEGKHRFVLTVQMVVPAALQQGGGGGSNEDAYMNVSTESDTMFASTRQMATRVSRTPFYPHIKVIIISEELAKVGEFANILDLFIRDPEMRRGTKVMVSKGGAREALDVKPPNEKLPAMYLYSVAENQPKTPRMPPPMRIGDLNEKLLLKESFTVPRIIAKDIEAKIAGVAVFSGHDNKMVAWLGEEETEGLGYLTGNVDSGVLKAKVRDNLIVYEIKGANKSLKADVSNIDNLKFTFTIESEGNIVESLESIEYLKDPSIWDNIETKLEEELKRLSMDTIKKLHEDLKVDVLEIGSYLRQNHPKVWEKVKDDWDHGKNYFAKSDIQVETKVIVRNPGIVNKIEDAKE